MEITPTIRAILLSIQWRSKKYWTFWLSRHEYEKYDTTQDKLRYIIKKLKQEWYITLVWYEPHPDFKANPVRAVYKATEKLFDLLKTFTRKIQDMNNRIINWCKEQNPYEILSSHGIELFIWGRIWKKNSKITISKKNNAISDWKTWEKYNLFDYLRGIYGQSSYEFFNNFIWL